MTCIFLLLIGFRLGVCYIYSSKFLVQLHLRRFFRHCVLPRPKLLAKNRNIIIICLLDREIKNNNKKMTKMKRRRRKKKQFDTQLHGSQI